MLTIYDSFGTALCDAHTWAQAKKMLESNAGSKAVAWSDGCDITYLIKTWKPTTARTTLVKWDGIGYAFSRDSQRKRAYQAENEAFGHLINKMIFGGDLSKIQLMVDGIVDSQFWGEILRRGNRQRCKVNVIHKKSGRALGSAGRISLPMWARTLPIVLHELAHSAAPMAASHSWIWAGIYVALVEEYMGPEWALSLRRSFTKHKVKFWYDSNKVASAAKPEPTESS